ncbi:MAG: efflux RND transporter periplasmic adaptor subunit, partial [Bacteroidota bacterium]|nr:efflux RND transporter periplasmic adaptor subunit [Bacteroidota bacterium]
AAAIVNQQQAQLANSQAAIGAMQAQLDESKKTYDMQKQLYDGKVISANEFNTAEAGYKSAVANLAAAKEGINAAQAGVQSSRAGLAKANKDISLATLVSPMDGVVDLLNVKKGERVVGSSMMAGTEMMRIADMSKIEIRVDVGENDIPKVHLGDSATIEVDAYNNRKFTGIVTQIASSNNGAASQTATAANTSTDVTNYKVYIRLDLDSYQDLIDPKRPKAFPFRPGMSASADIQTRTNANVLSIPINAVTTRERNDSTGNGKGAMAATANSQTAVTNDVNTDNDLDEVVFVIQADGTVRKQVVKTGIQDINDIEVTEGLKDGDEVVTGPYDVVSKTLKPKDKVKIVSKNELFDKK